MKQVCKSIVITCFNRTYSLIKCLANLKKAKNYEEYNIVFVVQIGNPEVLEIVNKFNCTNKFIIKTHYPKNWSALKKMAHNGVRGVSFCFEKLQSEFVCYLEDDIIISYDFLVFHEFIHNKYLHDKYFFGLNGFSGEKFNINKISLYSKFVYGLGKGFSFNKKIWNIIKYKIWSKKYINSKAPTLDGLLENFIKKNNYFVIMPICSRIYEFESYGLHINPVSNKFYFQRLRDSFVKNNFLTDVYRYSFFSRYKWRKDCRKYYGSIINRFIIYSKLIKNKFFLF